MTEKTKLNNEELKNQLKACQTKLRHISTTRLKELKKNLQEKTSEVEILKQMIRTRDVQIKSKENELGHMDKKVKRMERISDIHSQYGNDSAVKQESKKRRDLILESLDHGIEEVTELGTEEFDRQGGSLDRRTRREDDPAYEEDEFYSFEEEVMTLPAVKRAGMSRSDPVKKGLKAVKSTSALGRQPKAISITTKDTEKSV